MSYTPTTWVTGDKVTATKMNKIEQGIDDASGSIFVIGGTWNNNFTTLVLDKKYDEIYNAVANGKCPMLVIVDDTEGAAYFSHIEALYASNGVKYVVTTMYVESSGVVMQKFFEDDVTYEYPTRLELE